MLLLLSPCLSFSSQPASCQFLDLSLACAPVGQEEWGPECWAWVRAAWCDTAVRWGTWGDTAQLLPGAVDCSLLEDSLGELGALYMPVSGAADVVWGTAGMSGTHCPWGASPAPLTAPVLLTEPWGCLVAAQQVPCHMQQQWGSHMQSGEVEEPEHHRCPTGANVSRFLLTTGLALVLRTCLQHPWVARSHGLCTDSMSTGQP